MTEKDRVKLEEKLLRGLEKSYKDLLATKKRNKEDLIILKNDKIVKVKP